MTEPSEPAEAAEPSEPSETAEPSGIAGPSGTAGTASESSGEASAAADGLSERDVAVLGVERGAWPGPGAKERAIRERLGMSATRYYQHLNALIDDPRALAHDPVTVNRLRRLRENRRERR